MPLFSLTSSQYLLGKPISPIRCYIKVAAALINRLVAVHFPFAFRQMILHTRLQRILLTLRDHVVRFRRFRFLGFRFLGFRFFRFGVTVPVTEMLQTVSLPALSFALITQEVLLPLAATL